MQVKPRLNPGHVIGVSILLVGFLVSAGVAQGETDPATRAPDLAHLRREYAMRYFDARAHAALIRALRRHRRYLIAFGLLERARRMFKLEEMDRAYGQIVLELPIMHMSAERIEELKKRYEEVPDGDARLLADLVSVYFISDSEEKAYRALKQLLRIDPDNSRRHLGILEATKGRHYLTLLPRVIVEFAELRPFEPASILYRAGQARKDDADGARRILLDGLRRHPNDGYMHYQLGAIAEDAGDLDEAERRYTRAASLSPEAVLILLESGRFFLKKRKDLDRSLQFYARAHLRDYYSNAIWSVREIKRYRTQARVKALRAAGSSLVDLLREDDQDVVNRVLAEMAQDWKPEYIGPVVELIAHDHPYLGESAARILARYADSTFESKLEELLRHEDLRVRARALYIAVALRGEKSLALIEKALTSECQLIRWEAVGALFLNGGEAGKRIVQLHRQREVVPGLIRAIDADLKNWPERSKLRPEPAESVATEPEPCYGPLAPEKVKAAPAAGDNALIPEGCVAAGPTKWRELEIRGERRLLPFRIRHVETGIEMVLIAPGWYYRGASLGGWAPDEEKPPHKVTLTRPFYLARYETTNRQYRVFRPRHRGYDHLHEIAVNSNPEQPATQISWHAATAFAQRFGFRLPTEAEWEFACRAGTAGPHYGPIEAIAWYRDVTVEEKYAFRTHPVGRKKPNAWGLYDMLGNASEWCADWYDEKTYAKLNGSARDPTGPSTGRYRVLRGGDVTKGYLDGYCRASDRDHSVPTAEFEVTGFRVALDP